MTSEIPKGPPASAALALPAGRLRTRLARLLSKTGFDVTEEPASAWNARDHGVVVVLRAEVASPASRARLDALTADGGPAVVVVGDTGDPVDRADLLAAGADAVVPEDAPSRELTEVFAALAAKAAGAVSGPEHKGSGTDARLADFQTRSPAMRKFLRLVRKVAPSDTSLLITGETGVGKEHLARAIHAEGPRAARPFVAVNCAALPEELLESELFGHRAGAFTGATRERRGHFAQAEGGTIFLDEVGEMPTALQVKLLTVLQRLEVTPLGAEKPVAVDVRVMAASNRDLGSDVESGRFREDLFFRLNVVPLHIPALRERREDLPDLIGKFLRHFREDLGRDGVFGIAPAAMEALLAYDWPGNVRELVNVIERATLLCADGTIGVPDLPPEVRGHAPAAPGAGVPSLALPQDWDGRPLRDVRAEVVEAFERLYVESLLRRTHGRVGETARLAGITPRSLYDKMKRLGLHKEEFRG